MERPKSGNEKVAKFERREYSKESYYLGYLVKHMKHGKGTMMYSKKSYYEGYWIKDNREGKGLMVYPNGDRYMGEWLNDK